MHFSGLVVVSDYNSISENHPSWIFNKHTTTVLSSIVSVLHHSMVEFFKASVTLPSDMQVMWYSFWTFFKVTDLVVWPCPSVGRIVTSKVIKIEAFVFFIYLFCFKFDCVFSYIDSKVNCIFLYIKKMAGLAIFLC